MALSEACPFDGCNPDDCPLSGLRKMPRRKRLRWFNSLTEPDLTYLAAYHHICFAIKIKHRHAVG